MPILGGSYNARTVPYFTAAGVCIQYRSTVGGVQNVGTAPLEGSIVAMHASKHNADRIVPVKLGLVFGGVIVVCCCMLPAGGGWSGANATMVSRASLFLSFLSHLCVKFYPRWSSLIHSLSAS
jgi:hypothetical protein